MLSRRLMIFAMTCGVGLPGINAQDASFAPEPQAAQDSPLFISPNPTGSSDIVESDYFQQATPQASGRPSGLPFGLEAEWIDGPEVELASYDATLKLPLLFGLKSRTSPPPIAKFGFAYTDFTAADSFALPNELYEYSIGLSWVRPINDRWTIRTMLGVALATDNRHTSSDAWQFRGGAFAIYDWSPQWKWTIGAIALGRSDLPVLPAIGAVWQPNETTRVDLLLPNPRANFLLSDDGNRQHWAYMGAGLNGNTWAFETPDLMEDDTLTYGDVRIVAGWESRPSAPIGAPYVPGRKFNFEFGYAFSRDLEFDDEADDISLDDALLLRVSTSY